MDRKQQNLADVPGAFSATGVDDPVPDAEYGDSREDLRPDIDPNEQLEDDDSIDDDTRICEFCGTPLSGSSTWAYAGPGFDWTLRSFICPGDCRARGSVSEVEIRRDDPAAMPGDDPFGKLQDKIERKRTPYGANQSTFQPALAIDPAVFPDGTYHFVRIDPYVVEFRPPVGTDLETVQDWVERGTWDWAENVEVVPTRNEDLGRPVVLFRDRHNGPTARRTAGKP